jgi:hypothetical protein
MPILTIGAKAARVLDLMIGLREPRVARALAAHGFDEAEHDKGYELLRALTKGRLGVIGGDVSKPIAALDAFENKWFPIVDAVLNAHFPESRERVFLNLVQTEGAEVVISVGTLLERLDEEPAPVKALLAKRGLDAATLDAARGSIRDFRRVQDEPRHVVVDERADAAAEAALWNWYLEWSTIARKVVTNRRLLRKLGFLKTASGEVVDPPLDEDDDEGTANTTPAANTPAANTPAATTPTSSTPAGGTTPRAGDPDGPFRDG